METFSNIDLQLNSDNCVWFSTSSGRIEFAMPYELASTGYHSGACDDDIEQLQENPLIKAQLMAIDPNLLIEELLEYGAWDKKELSIHSDNLARILWLACGDIVENKE